MTDDPEPPPPPLKDGKGRFLPGNKSGRGRGRPKGSPNRFGPNFREKLLSGIARSGLKKARKAGVNRQVDGLEYFVEHLVDSNSAAAATLIAKLVPPEQPPAEFQGGPMIINVIPALPGGVLMPFEDAAKAWAAYRHGPEVWKEYVEQVKGSLTLAAFEKLSTVTAPEPPDKVVYLKPIPQIEHQPALNDDDDDEIQPRSPEEAQLIAELNSLSIEELKARAGIVDDDDVE